MIHHQDNTRTNFRISNMSVPELPYIISSSEETFQSSLRRIIILFSKTTKSIDELLLHLTKSQDNDVEDDGISEITKSTSETKPSKYEPSSFRKPTQITKVDHFHQLMTQPWQIFTTAGLDGVAEDKILTITQSISENSISKSKRPRLLNTIQIIKADSCHQHITQTWNIVTQSTSGNSIPKYKTSRLQNPTQMIKVASCQRLNISKYEI